MKKAILAAAVLAFATTGAFAQSSNVQTAPAATTQSGMSKDTMKKETTGSNVAMPKSSSTNEGAKTPSTSGADTANNNKQPGKEN